MEDHARCEIKCLAPPEYHNTLALYLVRSSVISCYDM